MSRKHHTRHERTPGGYRRRLNKRGLGSAPHMPWSHLDGAMTTGDISNALAEARRRADRQESNRERT